MDKITEFRGEYRWLSNFWFAPVKIGKLVFATNEHAFQAAKSLNPKDWNKFAFLTDPGEAKRLGKTLTLRPDWTDIRLDVMREITAAKYDQHPDLKAKLLATRGKELIEGNHWRDTFWGVCRGSGQNHLGKILMEYRDNGQ